MLLLIFVTCFLALLVFLYRQPRNLPPGPRGIPFVGNTILLQNVDGVLKGLRDCREKYGDIYSLKIGSQLIIYVAGQDALKEIFIKRGDITSDRPSSVISIIAGGKGILGSSGKIWKEHRTFASKTLRNFGVGKNTLEQIIIEEVQSFLSDIEKTNGKAFDIDPFVAISICNITSKLVLGKTFGHEDQEAQKVIKLITKGFASSKRIRYLDVFPSLRYIPGDFFGLKLISNNLQQVSDFLQIIVDEHRENLNENEIRDYIDEYLVKQKLEAGNPDTTFTDEQLKMSIRNLFTGGTDTSAATVKWATVFLIRNPKVQRKLREEIFKVIGPSQIPSYHQRTQMPYCQAFITETQRLGNVAPMALPHLASQEFTYKGYTIPKGATLMPNVDSLAFDPNVFPNPEIFDPERFISETGEYFGQDKIYPFSLGRRVCLAESMARTEIFLFVVLLVQRFHLLPIDEHSLPSLKGQLAIGHSPVPFEMKVAKVK